MSVMIRANKGRRKESLTDSIHATSHAVLIGLCLLVYNVDWKLLLVLIMIELVSHFVIDVLIAQIPIRFPY